MVLAQTNLRLDTIWIDYVLVGFPKLGGAGQVRRAEVAGDQPGNAGLFPSDHFAVMADVRY